MKKIPQIPAIRGLKYLIVSIFQPIIRSIIQWIVHPHPVIALTVATSILAHYGVLHQFSDESRGKLLKDLCDPHNFFLTLPIMIITAVCALITRRLMFHGGAALGDHHDEELDEGWPKQRIGYPQGIAWFITGIGRLYLWIANIVSNIVKGLCIAIMETVRFVLVTIPSVTIQSLIWMLRFFHSSKSLMVEFYVFLVMFTALGFATHYPALLNVTTVFRIFTPIVIVVSSWQMYHLLDKIGKKHTEHS